MEKENIKLEVKDIPATKLTVSDALVIQGKAVSGQVSLKVSDVRAYNLEVKDGAVYGNQ